MTERKLSTLGYLMDRLGLYHSSPGQKASCGRQPCEQMAQAAAGGLSTLNSVYFDEVCRMLLEQNPMALTDALRSLVPLEGTKEERRESREEGTAACQREGGNIRDRGHIRRIVGNRNAALPRAE